MPVSANQRDETRPLNFAGKLAQTFVESRLVILIILGILLYGIIGLIYTPREENPQIIVPGVEVRVSWPGIQPLEVEQALLRPLETLLASIDGVKHTYGAALAGVAVVQVEFYVGENKEDALVRVYDHVLRQRGSLPGGSGEPQIRNIDVDEVPVFALTLASSDYSDYELYRMSERVLERLRNVPGIGVNYIVGGRQRELRIDVDPERLRAFAVSVQQIRLAIESANQAAPLGSQVIDGENRTIRLSNHLSSVEELRNLVVGVHDSRVIHLRNVADVADGPSLEHEHYTRFSFGLAAPEFSDNAGQEMAAVTIAIAKRAGVDAVPFTEKLRGRVEQIKEDILPPDVHAIVTRDDGQKADHTVSQLVEHIFIAVGSVTIILLLFLGWRAALIVTLAVPLVIFVVLGSDLLAGPTLNRITLYALILSLGMLVDDAIVVIENAHRNYKKLPTGADQESKAAAVIHSTNEIGNPTTLATFMIAVVFLSLILVTGMLGQYFRPMTFNLPVAMVASLLLAYTVTPWMIRRWLPVGNHADNEDSHNHDRLQRMYRTLFVPLLERKRLRHGFYSVVTLLLVLSLLQPAWQFVRPQGVSGAVSLLGVPLAFLPKADKNTFLVSLHMPDDAPLEETDRIVREIEEKLIRHTEVVNIQSYIGISSVVDFNGQLRGSNSRIGAQYAEIRVNLTQKDSREISSIAIVEALRPIFKTLVSRSPEAVVQLVEDPPGPPVRATILAELYGENLSTLVSLAEDVKAEFLATYDMAEVFTTVPTDIAEYQITVDREKAALSGISAAQVKVALKQLIPGKVMGYAHLKGERSPVPICFKVSSQMRIEPGQLERVLVNNSQGQGVPLSELTRVEMNQHSHPILHKDTERVVYVGGELKDSAPVYAILDLDARLDERPLDDNNFLQTANLGLNPVRPNMLNGYKLLWEGELRLTLDAFRDMGLALIMALAVIYLMLVGYYRSFRLPLLAMVSIPLAMIGVFPGHWILGVTFSAASMIGVIALAGVVVRNSLLIIDFAQAYQKQGYSIDEAILEAGAVRLRPILLTTLAIIFGTAIMVPDAVIGGLAISLIFGVASSAMFTVFVIPLLYRRLVK
ncbi:MAG: efflux RND transporter permease subunit [Gammaproteobacteria bacterium]